MESNNDVSSNRVEGPSSPSNSRQRHGSGGDRHTPTPQSSNVSPNETGTVTGNTQGHVSPSSSEAAGLSVISTQDLDTRSPYVHGREMRHDAIPDLLHSHIIPTQPTPVQRDLDRGSVFSGGHVASSDARLRSTSPQAHRHHARHHYRDRHRARHSRGGRRSRSTSHSEDEFCKHGCLKCMAATTSFRWILVILSLLGVCCVVTGIVLAALHATGQSFLFLAIMFIGLGVLLVVVVAVGWRCTPRGHEPLHALFGLGDFRHQQQRPRGRSRHHGRRSRDSHWYGGMMYPEFQFRRPPPSYNASMQDFQHQLVLAQTQRERFHSSDELPAEDYSLPSSPPPSYRSRASTVRTGIQITFPPMQGDNSHPPTYRSHVSTVGQHTHSRPSLPRDGFSTHQNGSSANNTRVHSRNNSASNFRVHSRSGSNVASNTNSHSRTNSAGPVTSPDSGAIVTTSGTIVTTSGSIVTTSGAIVTTIPVTDTPQDQLLVQQTLQTLEDATSSAGIDNLAQDTQDDEDDDEYPMETPL